MTDLLRLVAVEIFLLQVELMLSLFKLRTYFGLEIRPHSFVVSKLDWYVWSASRSGHFNTWGKTQAFVGMQTEWILKTIWILWRRKNFFPLGNRSPNLCSSLPFPVSNRLTPTKQMVILTSRPFWEQNTSNLFANFWNWIFIQKRIWIFLRILLFCSTNLNNRPSGRRRG
jgi:hypothetical protein